MSDNQPQPRVITLVPQIHYLVALGYVILDRPGEEHDEHYVEMIGNFESLEDAKKSVEEHAGLIMDNDEQYLTIYKVDLNQCRLFDFHRKDLKDAVKVALKEQRDNEEKMRSKRSTNMTNMTNMVKQKGEVYPVSKPKTNIAREPLGRKPVPQTGDFPRPNQGLVEQTSSSSTVQLVPIMITPKPRTLG